MTADLVAFLRARLDEDEATARAVEDGSAPWTGRWENDNGRALRTHNGHVLAYLPDARPFKPGVLDHIVCHDPARVLADIESKRQLLQWYEKPEESAALTDSFNRFNTSIQRSVLAQVFRHLAQAYANHPDYREEWRP